MGHTIGQLNGAELVMIWGPSRHCPSQSTRTSAVYARRAWTTINSRP